MLAPWNELATVVSSCGHWELDPGSLREQQVTSSCIVLLFVFKLLEIVSLTEHSVFFLIQHRATILLNNLFIL